MRRDQVVLVVLRLLQAWRPRSGKHRAGVGHRRAEHHLVERVGHVVVVVDRLGVAALGVPQALDAAGASAAGAPAAAAAAACRCARPSAAQQLGAPRPGDGAGAAARPAAACSTLVGVARVDAVDVAGRRRRRRGPGRGRRARSAGRTGRARWPGAAGSCASVGPGRAAVVRREPQRQPVRQQRANASPTVSVPVRCRRSCASSSSSSPPCRRGRSAGRPGRSVFLTVA